MRSAFTLIELLVVVAAAAILGLYAGSAVQSVARNGAEMQAQQILHSSVVTASSLSTCYGAPVALRIERACKLDANGLMRKDAAGQPLWKDHQQISLLVSGFKQDSFPVFGYTGKSRGGSAETLDETRTFRRVKSTPVLDLPSLVWLAGETAGKNEDWQPSNANAARFNRFETFYIVFNYRGELTVEQKRLLYLDETQPYEYMGESVYPVVDHPDRSARAVTMYAREHYLNSGEIVGGTVAVQMLR